jgi:hypothetical protein
LKSTVYFLKLLLLLAILSACDKNTDRNSKVISVSSNINSLVPSGWQIFEKNKGEPVKVEGDLNKDGILDVAAIIEQIQVKTEIEEAPARALIIAFGTKENSY